MAVTAVDPFLLPYPENWCEMDRVNHNGRHGPMLRVAAGCISAHACTSSRRQAAAIILHATS